MKVSTFTATILGKIPEMGLVKRNFITHILGLYLSLGGRYNFLNMSSYGTYKEQSYRRNFEKEFCFKSFNKTLIKSHCSADLALIFDPSYIAKSGHKTPGSGYFWSGCAHCMKWGLEISGIAVADMENHTAMHYHASQTSAIKGDETLRSYYAQLIVKQKEDLQKISKIIAFDAFFSKKPFTDAICDAGFTMISRMQKNTYMRYKYTGAQSEGRGRKKEYGDKIDPKDVSADHFTLLKQDADEIIYEGIAHIRSLKRWCKVLIVQKLKEGKIRSALIYFSTDIQMVGLRVLQLYKMRFQIEFLYRDAKQFIGLEQCQSRQEQALEFHFNCALTTLNIAKAMHWLSIPKEQRNAFSMADIKTQYINELVLDKIISFYGKDPNIEKNNPEIKKLYQLGKIAA